MLVILCLLVFPHLRDNLLKAFHLGDLFHAEPLQISRQRAAHRPPVAVQLSQRLRILSGFLVVLYDAIYGLIESDQ